MIVVTLDWKTVAVVVAVVVVLQLARGIFGTGMDSTDVSRWRRSGVKVYTDNATGVQYLGTGSGITPRVGKDGSLYQDEETKG